MKLAAPALAAVTILCASQSYQLSAQQPAANRTPPPSLRAERKSGSVVLDGRLDEPAWQQATPAGIFTQSYPNPGETDSTTQVRVLYDDDALYVGVRMFDTHPDSIAAQLARRDATGIYSDWLHLIIDSYHDRRTAFRFSVNPKGVQKDVYTSNDGNEDTNWDAVWDVATRIDSAGWVAEYRIPFSQLRFGSVSAGTERVWGFQVMRDIARRSERQSFAPWYPNEGGFVSRFGDLTGLIDVNTPSRLEIVPYVSTKLTRAPADAESPFYHATNVKPNGGADLRYGLPGGLTLTGTVNPDFGQVEVDPAVVNLTAFESFFPEKRPFFLEGADIFNFGRVTTNNDFGGQTFFYTRRIGRAPQRFPGGPGIAYVDTPDQTTIAAAAKVTGKHGPWTIGILDAVTPEEHARVAGPAGVIDSSTAVDPLTNYFAGRVRRDFRRGASVVGGMLTLANRQQSELFQNLLSSGAGYGGIDFENRWHNNQYVLSGFAVRSQVNGSANLVSSLQRNSSHYFQRPDATSLTFDPTRTSLAGHAEEVAFQKNGKWFGSLALKNVSPEFEINDVGFHGRVDYRAVSPFFGYSVNQRNRWSLNRFAGAWANTVWNSDGTRIFQGFGSSASATFSNYQSANIGLSGTMSSYSDRLLRGGPLARTPAYIGTNANFSTDARKKIFVSPSFNYQRNLDDPSWSASGSLFMDTRPTTTLHIRFGPSLSKQLNTSQFTQRTTDVLAAATYGSRYVFANLTQTTLSLDTRIDWTLTSRLSLQSYFQPFVSVGRYENFKEFAQPRTFEFAVYGRDRGTITPIIDTETGMTASFSVDPDGAGPAQTFSIRNQDFNTHSLRGNAVLRWEYRPGSTLFFVWQQQRAGNADEMRFDASRDVGAIFRDRPTNIFLIKAAYWLSR